MTNKPNSDPVDLPAADYPIVGHTTMRRKDGSRYHVPLKESEAAALWAKIEAEEIAKNGTD